MNLAIQTYNCKNTFLFNEKKINIKKTELTVL